MIESRVPMYCSACGAQVSSNGRFCSVCGSSLGFTSAATIDSDEVGTNQETIAPPSTPRRPSSLTPTRSLRTPSSSGASLSSSDPISGSRFAPGQMIAGRYRVVSIAGRGGMGEVYRAEDLTLGQTVAIKFLPQALSQDAAVLERFHSEVRIARQVSHPNVCRVFDIGDADGVPFLSMEYVDGEDLVVGLVVQNILAVFPGTIHLSRWYVASGVLGFGAIALLALYSFHTALAGQHLFPLEAIDQ